MKKIYVVGSINTDLVIKTPYLPKKGETLTGEGFFTAHGGKGANQAVAASRLGGKVIMCGCVGNDSFGKDAVESLKRDGIDTEFIKTVDGIPTGTAIIIVSSNDNRIILDKGANACLDKKDIDKALKDAKPGDIYLTQLENPIDVIGYGLQKAYEKKMYVVLNPAPASKKILEYVKYCNLITPNETEIEILGGRELLLQEGVDILVTLGENGFELINDSGSQKYPCMKVEPVDTTAAGDTLCGGLVARLSNGYSLIESACYGSLAASIACTKEGAQPSIPKKDEIDSL